MMLPRRHQDVKAKAISSVAARSVTLQQAFGTIPLEAPDVDFEQDVVGKIGRVTGTIAPKQIGEVMVPIRGGSEAFHAYAHERGETIERGERVVVVEYHPPRTIVVSQA